jgi:ABC-type antimicrobial peptide transport system permease subunit
MTLPPRYKELSLLKRTHQQILSRLKDSPGIRNAAFASEVPMGGMPDVIALHVLKQPIRSPKEPVASYFLVSPSYFPVIGAHLREGRLIADSDSPDSLPVAVINRTMAERYWPGEDAVGRQIEVGSQRTLRTIVGVIDDVKQTSFREEPTAEMFISYAQSMNGAFPSMNSVQYAIQSTGNANLISSTVGNIVRTIGGEVLMSDFARLSTWVDESMSKDKLLTVIVGGFSIAMLFLTCLGTYGIVRESMTQRKRDFAICMALGASRQAVTISLLRDACLIILSSVVLAAPLVWATTRVFAPLLYHVQPWSPFTFVAVSLLTASTILFSCYKPAKDAFNLSPIMILRGE